MSEEEISDTEIIIDLLESIENRIQALEYAPKMCGGPETQELTMLDLVEMRAKLLRPKAMKANSYEIIDALAKFTAAINGEDTNTYLHVILKEEGRLDLLAKLLGDFARWIMKKYPPERTYKVGRHETS